MSARTALRAATAADHERVDRLFSRFNLAREDGYRRFLLAQAAAFLPLERAIDDAGGSEFIEDWPERRRGLLLEQDLADLGQDPPAPIPSPALATPAGIAGAIYVLEGSRLGGAVLKREVPDDFPKRFLTAPQAHGSWRKVLDRLDKFLYGTEEIDEAAETARQVFQRFEAGGLRYLELD